MTFVVAVAGKGGVGKSTLAALLVRVLAERSKQVVLAVDADPNANLGEKLGVSVERTIGDIREDLLKEADKLEGTSKHEAIRYQVRMAMVEGEKFDLLTMGRPEGRGCYCYINNVLRTFLDEIMDDYPYVVIDNEAGMEHLSRRTCRRMDTLLVVSDQTKVGLETAKRILGLARSMDIEVGSAVLVINQVRAETNVMEKDGFDDVVLIPYDKDVERLSMDGSPLTVLAEDSVARQAVERLAGGLKRRLV